MIVRNWRIGISVCALLLLVACGGGRERGKMVSVTIEPQRYFAERIAGDRFEVNLVVPPGQSPETYDPTPRQMARIGESAAYLRIGPIGFELAWMDKIRENNPDMPVFDLSEGIPALKEPEGSSERHEVTRHHYHAGGADPHVWSGIMGAKVIAKNTLKAFVALDPENADYYRLNYERLLGEIDGTEQVIAGLLRPLRHRTFIIYHPALTYFAAEFGLTQLCIEMEGKEPSPAKLEELVRVAREHDAKVVFVQREFDQKNAELIAKETGCHLVTIDPLAYDWSGEMIHIAKALADGEVD